METVFVPASPFLRENEVEADDLHTSSKHNRQFTHDLPRCLADRTKPATRKFNTHTHKKENGGLLFGPEGISEGRKRHLLDCADACSPDKCRSNFT